MKRRKYYYVILGLIIICIITILSTLFLRKRSQKPPNQEIDYSLSASTNGTTIQDGIIRISNNNVAKFDINFSVKKNNYEDQSNSYILYVLVNYRSIKFYADGNECNNVYNFHLPKSKDNTCININIPLATMQNPNNVLICIVPKNCTSNNYTDGMVVLYNFNRNDGNKTLQDELNYTDYETLKNSNFQGSILNQDLDKSKTKDFTILKSINISKMEDLILAFRTSNITYSKNSDYILLITVNGHLDDKNIYFFKEPSIGNILYKKINLSFSKGKKDVTAFLIAKNRNYQNAFENCYINRITVNVK